MITCRAFVACIPTAAEPVRSVSNPLDWGPALSSSLVEKVTAASSHRLVVRTGASRPTSRLFFSWGHTDGEGIVTNIGLGGCRVNTDVELTEDCCLNLKLQVPGSKPEIRVEKAVIRTVEKGSFGLSFSRVLGDEKKRLCQFLRSLSKEAA